MNRLDLICIFGMSLSLVIVMALVLQGMGGALAVFPLGHIREAHDCGAGRLLRAAACGRALAKSDSDHVSSPSHDGAGKRALWQLLPRASFTCRGLSDFPCARPGIFHSLDAPLQVSRQTVRNLARHLTSLSSVASSDGSKTIGKRFSDEQKTIS